MSASSAPAAQRHAHPTGGMRINTWALLYSCRLTGALIRSLSGYYTPLGLENKFCDNISHVILRVS